MTIKTGATLIMATIFITSGCVATPTPLAPPKNDKKEPDVTKALLKTSPLYAQKHQHKAVEENMPKFPNAMPLYRPPLFAQMVVFPYISAEGIYHGYQESWVKIKKGAFVLAHPTPSAKDAKIFK